MASSSSAGVAKRPKYSKFIQQQLPACRPVITPPVVISGFMLISVVFIPIGVASLLASRKVAEIVQEYESSCLRQKNVTDGISYIQNPATDKTCKLTLNVTEHMKPPIYVYHQLDNFHQNHRRYVKSRSDEQLRDPKEENSTSACKLKTRSNKTIVPCGLIAWSLFNDTYSFSRNGRNLTVNKKGISWKSDRDHKFGKDVFPKNFQSSPFIGGAHLNESIPLSEQEDLIVWMRLAALPTFRKLYGRIEVDLNKGESINVTIQNNYNTYSFDGGKKLVLSTAGWLGGKNDFHGIAYLIVGGLCFFLSLAFTIVYFVKPRQLGDPSYLSWNRQPGRPKEKRNKDPSELIQLNSYPLYGLEENTQEIDWMDEDGKETVYSFEENTKEISSVGKDKGKAEENTEEHASVIRKDYLAKLEMEAGCSGLSIKEKEEIPTHHGQQDCIQFQHPS